MPPRIKVLGYLLAGIIPLLVLALVGLQAILGATWLVVSSGAVATFCCVVAVRKALERWDVAWWGLASHLEAMRGGDFARRLRVPVGGDAFSVAAREANALADELREQRFGALEAAALVRAVMAEIDIAVFAVDHEGVVRLANEAGGTLLKRSPMDLIGRTADEVGLAELVDGGAPRTFSATFAGGQGRWELRRRSFRERGRSHDLILLAEVSRALREEERSAWQRLVRVLGHELNNSLTPIRSLAGSLADLVSDQPLPEDWNTEVREGLAVIAARAAALSRFMAGYTRLAQLPPPQRRPTDVASWVARTAALESRVSVRVKAGPPVELSADPDQLDQLLINLLRNAAEASADRGGEVEISWSCDSHLEVVVSDEGPGLASDANLFVPFFTTKPGGSGIGLVLSRQIAESHGGTLALHNREAESGCRAILRLPLRGPAGEGDQSAA